MARTVFNNKGLFLLAGMIGFGAPSWGASAYMKIDQVTCEAASVRYRGWCEVLTFAFGGAGNANLLSTAGGSQGPVSIGDVSIVKPIDLGTPPIFQLFAQGQHIRDVTLAFVKSVGQGEVEYLRIELTNCVFTKVNYGFGQEGLSIAWVRIRMSYRPTHPDGKTGSAVVVTWDRSTNQPY